MPIDADYPSAPPPSIPVTASAVVELSSLMCCCSSTRPPKVAVPAGLAARSNDFWGDGHPGLAEVVVLAHATGTLDDPEIDGFVARIREPVVIDHHLPLETEPEDERQIIRARLDRLASDGRLRARYARLVTDLWGVYASRWETRDADRARAVAAAWSARLAAGVDVFDLLPEGHIVRRDEAFAALVRAAQHDGTLRLAPSLAGRGHIVALPGVLSVSADAAVEDPVVTRRRGAGEIAERLRVLSDPTRLTILSQLSAGPAGVSELARTLHIAQPTASVHLRRLKEAGLVGMERRGARSVYSARPAAVEDLLGQVTDRLARAMEG
jgi:DNA-binding transcriptional ArsR family regulator